MNKLRTHKLLASTPAAIQPAKLNRDFRTTILYVLWFCLATVIATPAQTVSYTTLVNFDGTDGSAVYSGLAQGTDGNFYGTTYFGGAYDWGTVFKITPSGTLTTLHSFDITDGSDLRAGLVQAVDGSFYGTTYAGGAYGSGTVFRLGLVNTCATCRP